MGRRYQPFTKEVAAEDEVSAIENVLSVLGSKHRIKRKFIKVEQVDEVGVDDVTDPAVIHLLGVG